MGKWRFWENDDFPRIQENAKFEGNWRELSKMAVLKKRPIFSVSKMA